MQMEEKDLAIIFSVLGIHVPADIVSSDLNNEEIMIEILIEELTRYQGINIATDISLFPTEEDLWMQGQQIKK
jgi:hypothetical protein